jgi:hypothetical protein
MAARQPSASFTDSDASRSHGTMMTQPSEDPGSPRLALDRAGSGPLVPWRFAAGHLSHGGRSAVLTETERLLRGLR